MKYTPKQYAKALYELLAVAKESERADLVKRFAGVLWKRQDAGKIKDIALAFTDHVRQKEGTVHVEITSADDLKVSNAVFGKNAEVTIKKDPSLLGGVILKIDDLMVDNSIRGRLNKFKKALHI